MITQRSIRRLGLVAVAALIAGACAEQAQPPASPPPEATEDGEPDMRAPAPAGSAVVSSHRWSTRLKQGDGVVLINDHGDLRVRSAGDSGLHYAGVVQKLDGEPRDPDFRTERQLEALHVFPVAPDDWNGRVDGGVRLPKGSRVELRTTDGQIDVRLGDNDVVAQSTTGRISVRTEGTIEARGESGEMLIVLFGTDYDERGAGLVEAGSGNVEVWIQPHANVTVDARAGGGVDIDAGDSSARVERGADGASIVVGDGRARFPVSSRAGRLTVRVLPAPP